MHNKSPRAVSNELTERWRGHETMMTNQSPFGRTDNGQHDLRGITFTNKSLKRLELFNIDFSEANLDNLWVEDCVFEECRFDRAILTQLGVKGGRINNCSFRKSDMRSSFIGYDGTEISNCIFDGVRLARTKFRNAIFSRIEFRGREWSNIEFCPSGFWNCVFTGVFKGCMFYGDYRFPEDRVNCGPAKRTGFHDVSFRETEFHWTGFKQNCVFEAITLPRDGHAMLCATSNLREFALKMSKDSHMGRVLIDYLEIALSGLAEQEFTLVSRHDLIYCSDQETGSGLYDLLKRAIGIRGCPVVS